MKAAARKGLVIALAAALSSSAARADEQQNLVDRARITLDSFIDAPAMGEMRELMARARAVLVIPQMLKAGFVVGGAGGSGVLLARDPKADDWSEPAFYTLGAGSVGLQIGASASEVVMVVLTERGLDAILKNKVKLGADLSAAAGPVGVGAGAAATSNLNVDVVSFSRNKGLFAGVSLEGAVLYPRAAWNQKYYGRVVTPANIVEKGLVRRDGATPLRQAVRRFAEPPRRGS